MSQTARREFLVGDRSAMGGLWAVVLAESPADIERRFQGVTVYAERPYFISPELYGRIRVESRFPVDDPKGWLAGRLNPAHTDQSEGPSRTSRQRRSAERQRKSAERLAELRRENERLKEELEELRRAAEERKRPPPEPVLEPLPGEPVIEEEFTFYCGALAWRYFVDDLTGFCARHRMECDVERTGGFATVTITFRVKAHASKVSAFAEYAHAAMKMAPKAGPPWELA